MQVSEIRRVVWAGVLAGTIALALPSARAADEEETKTSADCENVQITVRNASGRTIKLISVDHQTTGRWSRGKIVFRTIQDGASHTWSGSFKDQAGQRMQFRVNTRFVIDAQTDRYSELTSALVRTTACASEETHEITVGRASG